MKIVIGSDHAGFKLKEKLKKFLLNKKIEVDDIGCYSEDLVDYPDYAFNVAKKVAKNKNLKGILICGTGTGMVMAANRIKGTRASLIYDKYTSIMARRDNNANIACLRGRRFSHRKQIKLIWLWLNTEFSGEPRYKKRIAKLK